MYFRALHLAVIFDQLDVLTPLLDVIATLDNRNEILNSVNNDQQTALQIASLTDNVEAVIVRTANFKFIFRFMTSKNILFNYVKLQSMLADLAIFFPRLGNTDKTIHSYKSFC